MKDPMVILAVYNQMKNANRHAILLKAEGVRCAIDFAEDPNEVSLFRESIGEIQLLVHTDDYERANIILEMDDRTLEAGEHEERPGEESMLVGGVVGMAGILTSLANFDGLPENMILFPFAVAAIGGILFWKGIMEAREEN
ncbi:MAG: hypothetical protein R3D00_13290 [Bacteroidia bacterium]